VDERERLAQQTTRNLRGLELERAGRSPEALTLYEQNVAEGFEGDWPYGRLVAAYERDGDLAAAERVLERAIEIFSASRRRTPADRRATVRAFKGRLRLVRRASAARNRASRRRAPRSLADSGEG
jgi:tetratricopeptide (TPR) repeat protein